MIILLDIARVSKSGYYKWFKTSDEPNKDHDDCLIIKKIFDRGKSKWGFRTIHMKLRSDEKVIMNHKKIIRIMNKYGLITKIKRKNPYKSMAKKTKEHRTFENKLDRKFKQETPYRFFCTDITYLFFNRKLAYLSVVKDIASGEIVSWELSKHIDMQLVLKTMEKMKNNNGSNSLDKVLIHSDQGFHYTNPNYINMIKDLGMVQSMSRKGNCIDNAPVESFFGHLKDEIDCRKCRIFEELREVIAGYIDYYNNQRYQWNLKKMTPVQYRNHLLAQK